MKIRISRSKYSINNPEALERFVKKASELESSKGYHKALLEGPHPPPEVLFQCATATLEEIARNEWVSHIAMCPTCAEEVFLIQEVQERLDAQPRPAFSETGSLSSILGELVSEIQISVKSFAKRLVAEEEPEPIPVFSTAFAGAFQFQRQGSYSCLTSAFTVARELVLGDQALFRIEVPEDGYLTVWMLSEADLPSMVFPSTPTEKAYVRRSEVKEIRLTVSGSPGTRTLKAIWTRHPIPEPQGIRSEEGYDEGALSRYAHWVTELPATEILTGTSEFIVARREPEPSIEPISQDASVVALRVVQPNDNDAGYWIPLLFKELRNGNARFGWSGVNGADLHQLQSRVRQTRGTGFDFHEKNSWKYGKFLLDLKPEDVLIYVNMPDKDKCTVLRVWGEYRFDGVWDPEQRGDFRHAIECEFVGTFDRNMHIIHPELLKRLKLRGSHWSLNSVKKHAKVLLVSL